MNDTVRGISVSLLIHMALMGLIVMLNAFGLAERPRVRIDLGILRSPGGSAVPAPKAPAPAKHRPAAQPAVQPDTVSPAAVPSPEVSEYAGPPAPLSDAVGSVDGGTASAGAAGPGDAAAQRTAYVNEYFLFIRDRIVKHLVFPPAAQRMGWSGKAVVSFVVCRDGQVTEIRIVESTGYPVLDRNVVDTIRRAAPFPKAPVEAELTLPIVYKLL